MNTAAFAYGRNTANPDAAGASHRGPDLSAIAAGLPAAVPFVGPETLERARGAPFRARLGANESAFGPSPKALAAMAEAARGLWQYGDPTSFDLKAALSRATGAPAASIVVGEGIDGLLGNLVRLLADPGAPVVTSAGAYPTFGYHVRGFGARLEEVPYREDREDLPALIARAAATGARLVYVANPDNPMGSHWSGADIEAALETLPAGTLLCLDEAYAEFAPDDALPQIGPDDPRVIRMRTFSKAHGLAGARIAYAIAAPSLAAAFDRVRNHFGVNRMAQAAALAALHDGEHLATVKAATERAKARIASIARNAGLVPLPSATNFVTIDLGADGKLARALVAALAEHGVFVRMPFLAPQDRAIRVTVGTDAALDVFEDVLPAALATARSAVDRA